jgi:hypothetical protein
MAEGGNRVLPVGLPAGVIIDGGTGERANGWIRRGPDFHVLPVAAYRMWQASAAGLTPRELIVQGGALGVPDPQATCRELTSEDLLLVLSDDQERRRDAFITHRLHLLMPGLGSVSDGQLGMGHDPGAPWVRMDPLTYGLLLSSNDGRSIWEVCAVAAETGKTPVEQVAAAFVPSLLRLLSVGLIALDAR